MRIPQSRLAVGCLRRGAREKVKLYLPPSRVIYLKLGVSFSFLLERRQLTPLPAPR